MASCQLSARNKRDDTVHISANLANGKANTLDLVTAVAETELAVETLVTVRDRVISAYQDILNMPI